MKITIDIIQKGIQSAITIGPFDRALNKLLQEDYEAPISLYDNAKLRIQHVRDHPISTDGNLVREDVIYVPNKGNFLTTNSPISASPEEATNAHRQRKEFYLTPQQLELALQDSVEFPLELIEIPTNRFNSEELTIFAFGNGNAETAQTYGDFLKNAGIIAMPVFVFDKHFVNAQDYSFAKKLWFGRLDNRSGLCGVVRGLHDDYGRVRGVLRSTGEASSQKISEALK